MKRRYQPNLTPRDLDVINELRYGRTNAEIAKRLFIQEGSVKWHLTQIYKILGIKSHRQLMAKLIELRPGPNEIIMTYREDLQTKLVAVPVRESSDATRA